MVADITSLNLDLDVDLDLDLDLTSAADYLHTCRGYSKVQPTCSK